MAADVWFLSIRVLASGSWQLKVFGSGAVFWASAADTFRHDSKYFGGATVAIATPELPHNKSLQGTCYSALVPRSLPQAPELNRCIAARGAVVLDMLGWG